MKSNPTVGLIGLGALGVLFTDALTRALGKERVLVLADAQRIARFQDEGVFLNGQRCDFSYIDAATRTEPVDLLIFGVKFGGLPAAISTCRHLVGPDTTVISLLNGITAEAMLSEAFGSEPVVWCIAQKMSAKKEGNQAICTLPGELVLGLPAGQDDVRLRELDSFFTSISLPHTLPADIRREKWSKLLCNTGCNQAALVFGGGYGLLQQPGKPRDTMIAAMREVVAVAQAEGIALTEQDVTNWCAVIDGFEPEGEPSMRQDGKAHRKSEVELFAGTIRRLAQPHGVPVPVNDWLYAQIQELESNY